MNEIVENKLYRYFDRFPEGVSGTYRDLEDVLGIDHVTIQRIVKESIDINAIVKGKGNSKETHFILAKYETKKKSVVAKKTNIFDVKKETKEITFNSRQHRLCDYLLAHCLGKDNRKDKVDILWDLREYYFEHMDGLPFKNDIKKSRHNYAEYVRLTNDISFINKHGEIRQMLIGSQGGTKGGIWVLRVGEQHDVIEKILGDGLKLIYKFWAMKKAAEKQGNYKLVFKNEKELLDILRQFDN